MAHYEPSHQDLRFLKIQLFLSLVVKELTESKNSGYRFKFKLPLEGCLLDLDRRLLVIYESVRKIPVIDWILL